MQVDLFVSNKMTHIPIIECGGKTLAPGEKLFVSTEISEKLVAKYSSLLVRAATVERDSLSNGTWEIVKNSFEHSIKNRDMANQTFVKVK